MPIKKIALVGCVLAIGYALIKWLGPHYVEIDMALSEPLPDGKYTVGHSGPPDYVIVKKGKIYCVK